jgi:hypothetical protein
VGENNTSLLARPVPGAGRGDRAILDTGCSILDKEKRNPLKIQHPETSIQHHRATIWNHGMLSKLEIKLKILGYIDA